MTVGGLQLLQQEFDVAGRRLRVCCPRDPDEVLDLYIAAGADGDPYWTRVWPSAIALAAELLRRPELVRGLRVADLGAGLGVAGIAAAMAGAEEVVLLDREPLALECALLSARMTGLEGVAESHSRGGSYSSTADSSSSSHGLGLTASADGARQASHASAGPRGASNAAPGVPPLRLSGAMFDWSWPAPQLARSFDAVLACDVLYEPQAVEPVAASVLALLRPSGPGLLLLADPPSRTAANRERFLELLRRGPAPFSVDERYEHRCPVTQIDPELTGGVREQFVAVQFMALRRALGNDTVGLKAPPPPPLPGAACTG